MTAIRHGIYSIGVVFKYAFRWSAMYIILMLISAFMAPARIYLMERLIDSISETEPFAYIFGLLLVIFIVLERLFSFTNGFLMTMISSNLNKRQMPEMLAKFRRIEYVCFEDKNNQDMLQKIAENPQSEILSVFNSLISITYSVISTAGIVTMFFRSSMLLGIISVVTVVPMLIFESIAAKKEMQLRWNMTTDIRKRYYLQQLFVDKDALQEIKLFNAKQRLIDLSEELTKVINKDMKRTLNKVILLSSASSIFILAYIAFSTVHLSLELVGGAITLGVFVSLITSTSDFYTNARGAIGQVAQFIRLSASIKYYKDFMRLPERKQGGICNPLNNGKFTIKFVDVAFKYPSSEKLVLKNINLTIKSGERIAFVGENGAGKTTVIKLILGIYQPTSGSILINGINNSDISDEDRHSIFSVIFQDYQRYQLTLRENVALGAIDKIQNDEAILTALKLADAEDIISDINSSNVLETNLGKIKEDGIDVSGGQWQRIALARAYMAGTPFIIMDEPTSALDPIAESEMYRQFSEALSHQSAIMISHRLASARMADKIYVFRDGTICESGSHDELIHKNAVYADMWTKQSSWYTESNEGC